MKEFIYLDTSFLHSFIAQTHSGLPTLINTEVQESQSKTSTTNSTEDNSHEITGEFSTGDFNIGVLRSPSAKGAFKIGRKDSDSETISLSQLDAGKEIISKQLHDNALSEFEKYVTESKLLIKKNTQENSIVGDYVSLTGKFSIVDLGFLQDALNKDVLIEFMTMKSKEELENKLKTISNNLQTNARKEFTNRFNQQKKMIEDQFSFIQKGINYASNLMATKAYIKMGKYILPLKNEYLRDTPRELNFRFGSPSQLEVCAIGKVTRLYDSFISGSEEAKKDNSVWEFLGGLSGMLETFLGAIELIAKDDIVLSPVAIYFE